MTLRKRFTMSKTAKKYDQWKAAKARASLHPVSDGSRQTATDFGCQCRSLVPRDKSIVNPISSKQPARKPSYHDSVWNDLRVIALAFVTPISIVHICLPRLLRHNTTTVVNSSHRCFLVRCNLNSEHVKHISIHSADSHVFESVGDIRWGCQDQYVRFRSPDIQSSHDRLYREEGSWLLWFWLLCTQQPGHEWMALRRAVGTFCTSRTIWEEAL